MGVLPSFDRNATRLSLGLSAHRHSVMTQGTTALERAFQLAKSGAFPSVQAIKRQLSAEGFSTDHITGKALFKQLNILIKAAREQSDA